MSLRTVLLTTLIGLLIVSMFPLLDHHTPPPPTMPEQQVPGQWTTGTPMPTARAGTGCAVVDGKIYVVAGIGAALYKVTEIYDAATDQWTTGQDMYVERDYFPLVESGGNLHAIGGYAGSEQSTIYRYNIGGNSWSKPHSLTNRVNAAGASLRGTGYSIGGSYDWYVSVTDSYSYDSSSGASSIASYSTARSSAAGLGLDHQDRLLLIGGSSQALFNTGGKNADYSDVQVFDPTNNSWTSWNSMPGALATHVAGHTEGHVFVAGGYDSSAATVATAYGYALANNTWWSLNSLPQARAEACGAAIDGKFYVIGGYNSGGNAVNTVYIYDTGLTQNSGPHAPSTPVIGAPSEILQGNPATITALSTDANGDDVYYEYEFDHNAGTTTRTTSSSASPWTASELYTWPSHGTYDVRVRALDSTGLYSEWNSTTVTVRGVPADPGAPSGPSAGAVSDQLLYTVSTTEPDGLDLTYEFDWGDSTTTTTSPVASGLSVSESHSYSSTGTFHVRARATSSFGAVSGWSPTTQVTITQAPILDQNIPDQVLDEDTAQAHLVDLSQHFSHPVDTLIYSVVSTSSTAAAFTIVDSTYLSVDATGSGMNWSGVVQTQVGADNAAGQRTVSNTFQVTINAIPDAPAFTSVPTYSTPVGQAYDYQVTGADGDGDSFTLTLEQGPAGMALAPVNRLAFTPGYGDIGDHSVSLKLEDSTGLTGWQNYTLTVTGNPASNNAPSIFSFPQERYLTIGQPWAYFVFAQDLDSFDTLNYSLVQGPPGMTISPSGQVTWTPSALGLFDVTVEVTDGLDSVQQSFNLTVLNDPSSNDPPQFDSSPVTDLLPGESWTYQVVVSDADPGTVLTVTLIQIQDGMVWDEGSLTLDWTAPDTEGDYAVTLEVSDGVDTTRQSFDLVVEEPPVIPNGTDNTTNTTDDDTGGRSQSSGSGASAVLIGTIVIGALLVLFISILLVALISRKKGPKGPKGPSGGFPYVPPQHPPSPWTETW